MERMGESASLSKLLVALALLASSCSFITDAGDTASGDSVETDGGDVDLASTDPENSDSDSDNNSDNNDADSEDGEGASTTTTAPEMPAPQWEQLPLELTLIAEYEEAEPIALASRSGTTDLYVAMRSGVINRIEVTFTKGAGRERISTSTRAVLDITEMVSTRGEGGLLGLAFSTDGRFLYVSYTDTTGDSVIDEYDIDRRTEAVVDSRRELLRVDQPFENHNGGHIAFGADGFLYVGFGDGGSAGDPEGNGQDPSTLLGSIVRIDTFADGDDPYTIPSGNPFAAEDDGAEEVFLYGVRNPWRFSFDSVNGDLWIGDVGQDSFEEINYLPAATGNGVGANLGWNAMEGTSAFEGASEPEGHVPPLFDYPTDSSNCSVTGGYVYRGELHPILEGVYVFGDYCSGTIWGLQVGDDGVAARELMVSSPRNQLVSFGEGGDGELYVLQSGGQILRIEPPEAGADE